MDNHSDTSDKQHDDDIGGPDPPSRSRHRRWMVAAGMAATTAVGAAAGVGLAGDSSSGSTVSFQQAQEQQQPPAEGTAPDGRPCPPGGRHGPGGVGTVASRDGANFRLERPNGGDPANVTTSGDTRFNRQVEGQVSDVTDGATVVVMGTAGADDSIAAARILVVPADQQPPEGADKPGGPPQGARSDGDRPDGDRRGARGTVSQVGDGGFTLTRSDGSTVKITTSGDTTVSKLEAASIDDVNQGTIVAVRGERGDDGTVAARVVTILPELPAKPPGR